MLKKIAMIAFFIACTNPLINAASTQDTFSIVSSCGDCGGDHGSQDSDRDRSPRD